MVLRPALGVSGALAGVDTDAVVTPLGGGTVAVDETLVGITPVVGVANVVGLAFAFGEVVAGRAHRVHPTPLVQTGVLAFAAIAGLVQGTFFVAIASS